jgi:putative nucleotidyltransferase with HDIG domain
MSTTSIDDRLEEIARFVYNHLREVASQRENPTLDPEYRWQHTLRVSHYGRMLAEGEGANVELVIAACLLHDVAHFDQDSWKDHGRLGARIIRPLLTDLGYSPEETENVCYSVAVHVDGRADFPHPETLESRIVSDADNIDRFGAYRIIQWCTSDVKDYKGLIAKLRQRLQTLEDYRRRRVMETETGHHLFNHQLDRQIAFFKALIEESDMMENSPWNYETRDSRQN